MNTGMDPMSETQSLAAAYRARGLAPGDSGDSQLIERQRSFQAALGRASGGAEAPSPEQAAHEAAEQLVTQCLILPMLKQLRDTNQAAPPFAPSQAERQFGALGDAQLAQRITSASRFPLVDRLARDLLKRAGAEQREPGEARALDIPAPQMLDPLTTPPRSLMKWQD